MRKSNLNLVICDAITIREDLGPYDQTSLNHHKLNDLNREIREAIENTIAALRNVGLDDINYSTLEPNTYEIEELYMVVSKVISDNIERILHEKPDGEPDEDGDPHCQMEALFRYRNILFEWFQKTYGIFQ